MKRITIVAVMLAAALAALALAGPAQATTTGPGFATCPNLSGWFVNPDETARTPEPTEAGLKFEATDLIHHTVTGVTTETLGHGTYAASPAPDQPSFFSVEVADSDGSGYATLCWNPSAGVWEMTTGGQFYSNVNPTTLVDLKGKSHQVVRFGVGYTEHPAGTVATVVSSVTFNGQTYPLTCVPPTSSPTPEPTRTTSSPTPAPTRTVGSGWTPRPTTHVSSSAAAGAVDDTTGEGGSGLPVTGPAVGWLVLLGLGVVAAGTGLALVSRRRKVDFTA